MPTPSKTYRIITTGGAYDVSRGTMERMRTEFDSDAPPPFLAFDTDSPNGHVEVLYDSVIGFAVFENA